MAYVSDPTATQQTEGWNQAWSQQGKVKAVFYSKSVIDERKSFGWTEEREVLNDDGSIRIEKKRFPGEGRPIFKEVAFIKKFTPGDATNIIDRAAFVEPEECRCGQHGREIGHDAWEFPEQWARFKAGKDQGGIGTPLEMLPGLPAPRIEELKHLPKAPVRTVEELANLSDGVLQQFPGLDQERKRAKEFLAFTKEQAPLLAAQAQVAETNRQLDELRAELAALKQAAANPAPAPEAVAPTRRRRAAGE